MASHIEEMDLEPSAAVPSTQSADPETPVIVAPVFASQLEIGPDSDVGEVTRFILSSRRLIFPSKVLVTMIPPWECPSRKSSCPPVPTILKLKLTIPWVGTLPHL